MHLSCSKSGLMTAVFRAYGKTTETRDEFTICKRYEAMRFWNNIFFKHVGKNIKAAGIGLQMLHNVLQVSIVDQIKWCRGIWFDFRWTQCIPDTCWGGDDYNGLDRKSEGNDTERFVILPTAANEARALLLFSMIMSEKKDRLAFLTSKI